MLLGHGNDKYRYGNKVKVDFSSNVKPGGTHPELIKLLQASLPSITDYPEPNAESFSLLLAEKHHLDTDNFLITNGATEAFYLLANRYRGALSQIFIPTFSEYEDAAALFEHEVEFIDWSTVDKVKLFKPGMVWICNPNNPTGDIVSTDVIKKWLIANPDTIFIVDEAYEDLCPSSTSLLKDIQQYANLIVVRSLTKCYGIAGLRLGFMASNVDLITYIMHLKMPWNINSLAIEAGKWALNQGAIVDNELWIESQRVQDELAIIDGVEVFSSPTSFFLMKFIHKNASDLKDYLIDNYGFLIRDASNFRGLSSEYVRIAVQAEKQNNQLIYAIKEWMLL